VALTVWLEVSVTCWPFGAVTVTLPSMPVGKSEIVTVSAVAFATAIDIAQDFVASCVEVAVIVAVPEAVGVKTTEEVIEPSVADQVTALLNAPVPVTVAVQVEV